MGLSGAEEEGKFKTPVSSSEVLSRFSSLKALFIE